MKTKTINNCSVFSELRPELPVRPLVSENTDLIPYHHIEYIPTKAERLLTDVNTQGVVHEIRTPLNNISLSLAHLRSEIFDPEMVVYLAIMERSTIRINELVTSLLKTCQINMRERVSLVSLVNEALDMSADRRALKHIRMGTAFGNEPCVVHVNRSKITMAILNVIINATEAVADGFGRIDVKIQRKGKNCVLAISDNGCGINKDYMASIFSPHFTLKSRGTGLGLAVTREILLDHNGEINVKSEEGVGTTFIITLPAEDAFNAS